jgi:hypothetical protein
VSWTLCPRDITRAVPAPLIRGLERAGLLSALRAAAVALVRERDGSDTAVGTALRQPLFEMAGL